MIKRILVPIDGSEHSTRAVTFATELAACANASLSFIHVLTRVWAREPLERYVAFLESAPNPDLVEIESIRKTLAKSGEAEGIELLEEAKGVAEGLGVEDVTTLLKDGDASTAIVRQVNNATGGYDVVILGRRGIGGLKGLVVGSVSQKVSAMADCTVVMVN